MPNKIQFSLEFHFPGRGQKFSRRLSCQKMKALGLVAHPRQACRCRAKDGNWAESLCEERNASFSIRTNKVSQCLFYKGLQSFLEFTSTVFQKQSLSNEQKATLEDFWLAQILPVIDGVWWGVGGLSQVSCLAGAEPSLELWCQTVSSTSDA